MSELYPVGEQSWAQGFIAFPFLSEALSNGVTSV